MRTDMNFDKLDLFYTWTKLTTFLCQPNTLNKNRIFRFTKNTTNKNDPCNKKCKTKQNLINLKIKCPFN